MLPRWNLLGNRGNEARAQIQQNVSGRSTTALGTRRATDVRGPGMCLYRLPVPVPATTTSAGTRTGSGQRDAACTMYTHMRIAWHRRSTVRREHPQVRQVLSCGMEHLWQLVRLQPKIAVNV